MVQSKNNTKATTPVPDTAPTNVKAKPMGTASGKAFVNKHEIKNNHKKDDTAEYVPYVFSSSSSQIPKKPVKKVKDDLSMLNSAMADTARAKLNANKKLST